DGAPLWRAHTRHYLAADWRRGALRTHSREPTERVGDCRCGPSGERGARWLMWADHGRVWRRAVAASDRQSFCRRQHGATIASGEYLAGRLQYDSGLSDGWRSRLAVAASDGGRSRARDAHRCDGRANGGAGLWLSGIVWQSHADL